MDNLNEFKGASKSKRNDSYGSPQALIFDVLLQVAHLPGDGDDSLSEGEIIPFSGVSKSGPEASLRPFTPPRWPPSRVCLYSIPYFICSAPTRRAAPLLLSFRLAT